MRQNMRVDRLAHESNSKKEALKRADDRMKCESSLRAVCRAALRGACAVVSWLGQDASWAPPALPCGLAFLQLVVDAGEVDVAPLARALGSAARLFCKVVECAGAAYGPCKMGLLDMLIRIAACSSLMWLTARILWQLGRKVEGFWIHELQRVGTVAKLCELNPTQVEKGLSRYFVAGCRLMHDQQWLSLSIDGSRMGHRKMQFGLIARPDNKAMVFPPQAPFVPHVTNTSASCVGRDALIPCIKRTLWYERVLLASRPQSDK